MSEHFELSVRCLVTPCPGNVRNAMVQYGMRSADVDTATRIAQLLIKVEGVHSVTIYRVTTQQVKKVSNDPATLPN